MPSISRAPGTGRTSISWYLERQLRHFQRRHPGSATREDIDGMHDGRVRPALFTEDAAIDAIVEPDQPVFLTRDCPLVTLKTDHWERQADIRNALRRLSRCRRASATEVLNAPSHCAASMTGTCSGQYEKFRNGIRGTHGTGCLAGQQMQRMGHVLSEEEDAPGGCLADVAGSCMTNKRYIAAASNHRPHCRGHVGDHLAGPWSSRSSRSTGPEEWRLSEVCPGRILHPMRTIAVAW